MWKIYDYKKKKYIGRLTLATAITSILFFRMWGGTKGACTDGQSFLRENIIPDSYGTERFTHTADYHQSERAGLYQVFLWCDKHGAYA